MGPNGSGKSTLSNILSGKKGYEVTKGNVKFGESDLLDLDPEERSYLGLFLAFQYPVEIPGVSNEDFLRVAYNSKIKFYEKEEVDPITSIEIINKKLDLVSMDHTLSRQLNVGFSGGEKKRNEILQMALLEPEVSILDETDSGLDIDALKIVATGLTAL